MKYVWSSTLENGIQIDEYLALYSLSSGAVSDLGRIERGGGRSISRVIVEIFNQPYSVYFSIYFSFYLTIYLFNFQPLFSIDR